MSFRLSFRLSFRPLAAASVMLWALSAAAEQLVVSHSGRLLAADDQPVTGAQSLGFKLYDAPTGGQLAWFAANCAVDVKAGHYSVLLGASGAGGCGTGLDAAAMPPGAPRYLEVTVGNVTLAPRQVLTTVPTALLASRALVAESLSAAGQAAMDVRYPLLDASGKVPLSMLPTQIPDPARLSVTTPQTFAGPLAAASFVGSGAGLTGLDASALALGTLPDARLSGAYSQSLALTNPGNTFRGTFEGTFVGIPTGTKMEQSVTRTTCTAADRGVMYLNTDDDQVYVCGASGWKKVSQRAGSLRWTDTTWAVGNVYSTPASRTFTLQNEGDMPVSGLQIVLPTRLVQQSTTCGTSLAGAAACTVTVATAHPGNPGVISGDIVASGTGTTSTIPVSGQFHPLATCAAIKAATPAATSGTYTTDLDGAGAGASFSVYCDMTSADGPWTLMASVVSQGSFWAPSSYSASNSARAQSIGTPGLDTNYVMHLTKWKELLALGGSNSWLRVTVRRIDNNQDVPLGYLKGIQMNASAGFTNPTAAYDGSMSAKSPATSACVIQYNSDFQGTITNNYFQSGEDPCSDGLGWNGSCGYPSLGHTGPYAGSGSAFSHACSLQGNYYCSGDNMTGSGSAMCFFKRKWYWIK